MRVAIIPSSEVRLKGTDIVEVNEWAYRATLDNGDFVGQGGFGHGVGAINDPYDALTRTLPITISFAPGRTGHTLGIPGFWDSCHRGGL